MTEKKNLIVLIVILLLSTFQLSNDLSGQTIVEQPLMYYGDTTRNGDPFSKDPSVIYYKGRYLLYYSMLSSTNPDLPKGWAIGIAESHDMVNWKKVGDILPIQDCEKNGIVNGRIILLDGVLHLFYNSYGNFFNNPTKSRLTDALCHATSIDGIHFDRDPSNPIWHPKDLWNNGRAIDLDVVDWEDRLIMYYATRDPSGKIQMLHAIAAERNSDFSRSKWTSISDKPIMKPVLDWETRCIEAPSVIKRYNKLFMFYGGGYNNDPQQVGCAISSDGINFQRLFQEPLIPNGEVGDWNSSETGHPGIFEDLDGKTYLFVQGNNTHGQTWFISCYEIGWRNELPYVIWDSEKFPMKKLTH